MNSALLEITKKKIAKVEERRSHFAEFRRDVNDLAVSNTDEPEQVKALLRRLRNKGYRFEDPDMPANIGRFLEQAEFDTSISPAVIQRWGAQLSLELQQQATRYDFTLLYGHLLTELLVDITERKSTSNSGPARNELYEQQQIWEQYAFTEKAVDQDAIKRYLDDLFELSEEASQKAEVFREMRKAFSEFSIHRDEVSVELIKQSINNILAEDLYEGDKRKSLEDLKDNKIMLVEIMNVVRSDLDALDDWQWETDPLIARMRRHINGKYRVYLDEDITQAVFIEVVASFWADHVKSCLDLVMQKDLWNKAPFAAKMPTKERHRQMTMIGTQRGDTYGSVNRRRFDTYKSHYFVRLSGNRTVAYDDDGDNDDDDDNRKNDNDINKSPSGFKQYTLRMMTTELILLKNLYGKGAYLQTDFKWFGPSVPHATLGALFRFMDIPPQWIRFFEKFLRPTIKFDCVDGEPKRRVRGIPMSHKLSTVFGELLLFMLDFDVNQATGSNIYRIFDDINFSGSIGECQTVWKAITRFTDVMGLELNDEKSAAIVCSNGEPIPTPPPLPDRPVRWGFLKLMHDGSWVVNEESLEEHCAEMQLQLVSCKSIFAFIHAYNTYMRFFANNLAHPAFCFGEAHLVMVAKSLVHIQNKVLLGLSSGKHTSIAAYLRERINTSPHLHSEGLDVPEPYFYFPVQLGGLNLVNPLVSYFGRKDGLPRDPCTIFAAAHTTEKTEYEKYRNMYYSGDLNNILLNQNHEFLSFEEYTIKLEDTSYHLGKSYKKLLSLSAEEPIKLTRFIQNLTAVTGHQQKFRTTSQVWALEQFGLDVFKLTGSIYFGEKDLLPLGLAKIMLAERMRWKN